MSAEFKSILPPFTNNPFAFDIQSYLSSPSSSIPSLSDPLQFDNANIISNNPHVDPDHWLNTLSERVQHLRRRSKQLELDPEAVFTWDEYSKDLPIKVFNDRALQAKFQSAIELIRSVCPGDCIQYFEPICSLLYYTLGPLHDKSTATVMFDNLASILGTIPDHLQEQLYDSLTWLYHSHERAIRLASLGEYAQSYQQKDQTITTTTTTPSTTTTTTTSSLPKPLRSPQHTTVPVPDFTLKAAVLSTTQPHLDDERLQAEFSFMSRFSHHYPRVAPYSSQFALEYLAARAMTTSQSAATAATATTTTTTATTTTTQKSSPFFNIPDSFFDLTTDTVEPTEEYDSVVDEPHSASWLLSKCQPAATWDDAGRPLLSAIDIAKTIITACASSRSADVIQNEFASLLGWDNIEFIFELVQHRIPLGKITPAQLSSCKHTSKNNNNNNNNGKSSSSSSSSSTTNIKKFHPLSSIPRNLNSKHHIQQRNTKNDFAQHDKILSLLKRYHNVSLDEFQAGGTTTTTSQRSALQHIDPKNITRSRTLDYEQVVIAPEPRIELPQEDRIPINDTYFHKLVLPAFGSIPTLNTLQSKVYPCAYQSTSNMLVCASTGAGKTNVALMSILQQVTSHIVDDEFINKDAFKIVYIAPMKALAAEIADKFHKALSPLGLSVREYTGDMQLTRRELQATQVIVSTPEKWDVITRKSNDNSLMQIVKLVIIDEIHLLHEDRGPVLETIVARTHRFVETSQQGCRIVGLSATLPNYRDVARFLGCHANNTFYFDSRYRPVPLEQTFIGLYSVGTNPLLRQQAFNEVCYKRVLKSLQELNQVMVFVHSRNDTAITARFLQSTAARPQNKHTEWFDTTLLPGYSDNFKRLCEVSSNSDLRSFAPHGIGIHHAGLTRAERQWVESSFAQGFLVVLVSTATLSWGVNLPAHTVILKGTQLYDAKRGGFVDVGMLDVMQIFGRAGRPQFDTSGEAVLITMHNKLNSYLTMLTSALPIESQMISALPDHLNAEIILGTVSNFHEADVWLTYTYLYQRMMNNPTAYGIPINLDDPELIGKRRQLITQATNDLMKCRMVKFHAESGNYLPTDLGRIASLYYLHHTSMAMYNRLLRPTMTMDQLLDCVAHSKEFENLTVRPEEEHDLKKLQADRCPYPCISQLDSYVGKSNILLQCYISQCIPRTSTLASDQYFIQQSAGRIVRALFEMAIHRGKAPLSAQLLDLCKFIEHRQWPKQHPLRQFGRQLHPTTIVALESCNLTLDDIISMSPRDIAQVLDIPETSAKQVLKLTQQIPWLALETQIQPLTRDVLRVNIHIDCEFTWVPKVHGDSIFWWVWIEDPSQQIYHYEQYIYTKQLSQSTQLLTFTIPISEPFPTQFTLRVISDSWIGSEMSLSLPLSNVVLPSKQATHTPLLPLQPVAVRKLFNPRAERLFSRFTHFNPVQSQVFHTLYHHDTNVLLGAPTGSGKTVVAELAICRVLNTQPGKKIIYIAPMKALVRERYLDWSGPNSFGGIFGCSVLELTGDSNPDSQELNNADIVITTPEKWDGISRSWQTRQYVKNTALMIIDEIHLLGQDRGPILEVIVSRMRYITAMRARAAAEAAAAKNTALRESNATFEAEDNAAVHAAATTTTTSASSSTMSNNSITALTSKLDEKQQHTDLANTVSAVPDDSNPNDDGLVMPHVRFIGLSTAASNANDLADWLNIPPAGLFNFDPSVRPVPMKIHIAGFPGKNYCPRMSTMNKPCYAAITTHSPSKPVLVFVSSRRQTRLTALALITFAATDNKSKQWVHMSDDEMEYALNRLEDDTVKHCISYGIGIHHAGLLPNDRHVVEQLYLQQKIQILVATSVVAWGVNYPAHLVIVKDVQFYDTKTFKYADYQITDVLQMIGRSGRPQFDTEGKAVVLVQDTKKTFFQRFLHSPFPIESSLHKYLHNHLNAEIAQGSIQTLQDATEWLSWTFLFRRLLTNPTYYGLPDISDIDTINRYCLTLLQQALSELERSACVRIDISTQQLLCTSLGQLAAYYYIDYHTIAYFYEHLHPQLSIEHVLRTMSFAYEFWELPVRHNEDVLNQQLMQYMLFPLDESLAGNPHIKTNILFQSRLLHLPLPINDYLSDTQSAMSQSVRIIQAMLQIAIQSGWVTTTLNILYFGQMLTQAHFPSENAWFTNLPHISPYPETLPLPYSIAKQKNNNAGSGNGGSNSNNSKSIQLQHSTTDFETIVDMLNTKHHISFLPQLMHQTTQTLFSIFTPYLSNAQILDLCSVLHALPRVSLSVLSTQCQPESNMTISIPAPQLSDSIHIPFTILRENSPDTTFHRISAAYDYTKFSHTDLNDIDPTPTTKPSSSSSSQHRIPDRVLGPTDFKSLKEGWYAILSTNDLLDSTLTSATGDVLLSAQHCVASTKTSSLQLVIDIQQLVTTIAGRFVFIDDCDAIHAQHKAQDILCAKIAPGHSLSCRLRLVSENYVGLDQEYDLDILFE